MNTLLQEFIAEYRAVLKETKNKVTSVEYFIRILFDLGRLIKLFDPLIWKIVLSYKFNPPGVSKRMKIYRFVNFTSKSLIFFVVVVLIYRINNRTMVERKSVLLGLFPIPMHSIGPTNDTVEEALLSSHINRLVISLLSLPKGNKISERSLLNPKESIQKSSMPESNRLSRWWKQLTQKRKERSIQDLEDASFLQTEEAEEEAEEEAGKEAGEEAEEEAEEEAGKEAGEEAQEEAEEETGKEAGEEAQEEAEIESNPLLKCLSKDSKMSRILKDRLLQNPTRSIPSFFSAGWSELQLGSNAIQRSTIDIDQKLLKKEQDLSVIRRSETTDMVKLFKIILYLHNTVSIHPRDEDKAGEMGWFKSLPFPFFLCKKLLVSFSYIQNDQRCPQLLESLLGLQIVKKLKPFLLDDHQPCQRISKSMVDSFQTRKNCSESFAKTDSDVSMIFGDPYNWLNPVKAFHRSSLISAFYKANRLRFGNNSHYFCFDCNKRFPFYVEKAPMNTYDFIYRQFLTTLFIRNKKLSLGVVKKKPASSGRDIFSPIQSHAFSEREILSAIQAEVSKILKSKDFPQSGHEMDNLDKSFYFESRSDIVDISGTPLTEEQIVNLERTACQPLSDRNLADSQGKKFPHYFSDMNLADSEETNFDQSLSDRKPADSAGTNVDQSLSDFEQSLSDRKPADSEGTNVDQSLSDFEQSLSDFEQSLSDRNLADSEGTKVDQSLSDFEQSLSDRNLADSEWKNLDEYLSNIKLDESEGTNFEQSFSDFEKSLSDRNLADSDWKNLYESLGKNFNESFSDRNLADSERTNLRPSLTFTLNRTVIPAPSFDKFLALELEKRKKDRRSRNKHSFFVRQKIRRLYLRAYYNKMRIARNKRAFSTRSKQNLFRKYLSKTKWKLFKRYLPWALTSTGFRYLTYLFLDIVSEIGRRIFNIHTWRIGLLQIQLRLLRRGGRRMTFRLKMIQMKKKMSQMKEKMRKMKENWTPIFKKCETELKKWDDDVLKLRRLFNLIKTTSKKAFHEVKTLREENNEALLILTDWKRRNLREFFLLMEISFFFLVYILSTTLFTLLFYFNCFLANGSRVVSLIRDESLILSELKELLAEYPPSESKSELPDFEDESPSFGLRVQNFFIGILENIFLPGKKKNIFLKTLIDSINFIASSIINYITFTINTRSISPTTKEIYSFIIQRKKVDHYCNWNQAADWVATNEWLEDEERDVLMQFLNLRRERSISEILWSLTHSDDQFVKYDVLPELSDQPGEVYLRTLIDFHQKGLLNYEFNTSSFAEKRIFLALYHTITYSQTSSQVHPFPVASHKKPFSLRLPLAPSKSILVIGCVGLGRSYLVNYLAKNSYLPFITIFLDKFRGAFWDAYDEEAEEPEVSVLAEIELFIDTRDEIEIVSEDIETIDLCDSTVGRFFKSFVNASKTSPGHDLYPDLDRVSLDDDTEDMETVPFLNTFYTSLQFELAKAMSPCIIWIPNIHQLGFEDSDFFSLGLLEHLLSWNSEKYSNKKNLVIASTHIPQQLHPALIDTHRFNTCIKVRRPTISQQRKHLLTLVSTRGFRLEREIFNTTKFESITLGSSAQDLAALTNEALAMSLSQGKSILDSNTLRQALHRQTWDLRAQRRTINNSEILFYQIGRVVAQYLLLNDCPIDTISIYMNKRVYQERDPYVYRWYYQLGMSLKKLTILIYLLTCSSGVIAQDLWSRDATNGLVCSSLVENNAELVEGLLEIEGVLEGLAPAEKDSSQFDKDRVPVLRQPEPRNPSDMIHTGFWSIIDQGLIYQIDPSVPGINVGGIEVDLPNMFGNLIISAPRIWSPWSFLLNWIERLNANELGFPYWNKLFYAKQIEAIFFNNFDLEDHKDEENDSHSDEDQDEETPDEKEKQKEKSTYYELEDEDEFNLLRDEEKDEDYQYPGTTFWLVYYARARFRACQEQIVFQVNRFIWDPGNPLYVLYEDPFITAMFSSRKLFPNVEPEEEKLFVTSNIKSLVKSWFIPKTQEKHFKSVIERQRWLRRPNNSVSKELHRSTALFESYQYLSKMFLSNRTVLNQMKKLLVSKRLLFPNDLQNFFKEQYTPAETRTNENLRSKDYAGMV